MSLPLLGAGPGAGGSSHSSEATAFIARTSGLDATHINAYNALIDGLVTDGIWSKFDMLHIYATQDSTTALLNLVSSSYGGTTHGSPTFTADRGFTGGTTNNSTVYIDTGFNAATAGSPKYTTNSAHLSAWAITNASPGFGAAGLLGATGGNSGFIVPRNGSANAVFVPQSGQMNFAVSQRIGHYHANRSGASANQGYINGSSVVTGSGASSTVPNNNMYTLAANISGTSQGDPNQVGMASIGSSLSGTEAGNFYTRLRTYMTAVGVP